MAQHVQPCAQGVEEARDAEFRKALFQFGRSRAEDPLLDRALLRAEVVAAFQRNALTRLIEHPLETRRHETGVED